MSEISVDLSDPLPPYEQIRRGILAQIAVGALGPGDRLPSIRALAVDLGIAPGTVARAYKELEEAELLRTRRGAGTRVADPLPERIGAAAGSGPDPRLAGLFAGPVAEALAAGYSEASITAAVRALAVQGAPVIGGTSRSGGSPGPGTLDQ